MQIVIAREAADAPLLRTLSVSVDGREVAISASAKGIVVLDAPAGPLELTLKARALPEETVTISGDADTWGVEVGVERPARGGSASDARLRLTVGQLDDADEAIDRVKKEEYLRGFGLFRDVRMSAAVGVAILAASFLLQNWFLAIGGLLMAGPWIASVLRRSKGDDVQRVDLAAGIADRE